MKIGFDILLELYNGTIVMVIDNSGKGLLY